MTLATNLSQVQQLSMPEFYEFFYNGTFERYTLWETDLTFLGNLYKAQPIARSGFTIDTLYSAVRVDIRTSAIAALSRYAVNTPTDPTTITVYRALKDDLTDYEILFEGVVMDVSQRDFIYQAKCNADSNLLESYYPRKAYQSYCNHAVFDIDCGLDSLIWRVQAAITLISGADYTANGLNAYVDGYFTGGVASYNGDERMITNHVGDIITLHVPFDSRVAVDSILDFYPGCDGSPDTCKTKFNNYNKFLGMPLIPSSNPVVWGM